MDELKKWQRKLEYAAEDSAETAEKVVTADIWGQLGEAALWFGAFVAVMLLMFFIFAYSRGR